jgi:hypothetical protein
MLRTTEGSINTNTFILSPKNTKQMIKFLQATGIGFQQELKADTNYNIPTTNEIDGRMEGLIFGAFE